MFKKNGRWGIDPSPAGLILQSIESAPTRNESTAGAYGAYG